MPLKHFIKINEGIDVRPLLAELDAHPELWNAYDRRVTAPGTPHSAVSDIWVRYNDVSEAMRTGEWKGINDPHIPVWYPAWRKLPSLRPIVFALMGQVEAEMLGGVLITRIPPGAGLDPHIDEGWHVEYYEKFYLSLKSGLGANFICEHEGAREILNPKPGEIWLFDNRKRHWVQNNSTADRITAIFCIRTSMFGRY